MKNDNAIKNKKRVYYFDILRFIACLSVIMIHSSGRYVVSNFGSFNFWIGNILDGFSRIGVPIFIMISGALFLDKKYVFNIKKLIKHINKMVLFFIFWSIVYTIVFKVIYPKYINNKAINIQEIIKSCITGYYHLWFIYIIIGLYLIIPLLRVWVKDENKKYVEYYILLSLIFTFIIPQIISIGMNYNKIFGYLNTAVSNLHLKYVGGYTTYFILGWYVNNYNIERKRIIYLLGALGFLITILGTYYTSITIGKAIQIYGNLYINIFFQTLSVFLFIKEKYKNTEKENKIIKSISKYSLGIYALHAAFVTIVYDILTKYRFESAIINIPIVFSLSLVVAFLGSYLLSKIPILKKIV